MRNWIIAVSVVALALAGCGKKQDQTAGAGAADTSLAQQNSAAPTGAPGDTSNKTISQQERGGTALPPGQAENPPTGRHREEHHAARQAESRRSAGGEEHAAKPAPPEARYATLPDGKTGGMTLVAPLSSETSKVGDEFTATLTEDWTVDNETVLPAGTKVIGHVAVAEPAGRGKSKAKLGLSYDKLELPGGQTVDLSAQPQNFEAEGTTKRDIAVTGAGAVIGGLIGHAAGDTKKGAIIGGLVGGGAALGARGKPMELEAGHKLNLTLQGALKVPVTKGRS